MTREELIGTWRKLHGEGQGASYITLNDDDTATILTSHPSAVPQRQLAEWHFVDPTFWQIRVIVPPEPTIPGLEEGGVEVLDHHVLAFSENRMEVKVFDTLPQIYEKIDQLPEQP